MVHKAIPGIEGLFLKPGPTPHAPRPNRTTHSFHAPILPPILRSAVQVGFGVTKLSILLSLSSAFLLSTILVSAGQKQRTPVALKRQQWLRHAETESETGGLVRVFSGASYCI